MPHSTAFSEKLQGFQENDSISTTLLVCLSITMRQKNKYGNFKFCSLSWYMLYMEYY